MTKHFSNKSKFLALGLAVAAAVAMPMSASARGWGGHGYHGGYHGRYYDHDGGHWSGGRWIAGAIVTGAVLGLVGDALRPAPVYYGPPVVYAPPRTVIYQDGPPVVERRVVTRTVVYSDGYPTRYVRDDGYRYDDDDGD
ncbi:MAG: hypothetical protein KGM46_07905 [Pseudomonadota bacterium]|jgi:hypothetical protein|nr:hypothetical protein [Xanthomonadaceae bacterium]MDE2247739.1 hypothetical protein [Xanthomonadaceae bacterium]MDE3210650.1 hypothetical protein [Pseudomonadota bacterium]